MQADTKPNCLKKTRQTQKKETKLEATSKFQTLWAKIPNFNLNRIKKQKIEETWATTAAKDIPRGNAIASTPSSPIPPLRLTGAKTTLGLLRLCDTRGLLFTEEEEEEEEEVGCDGGGVMAVSLKTLFFFLLLMVFGLQSFSTVGFGWLVGVGSWVEREGDGAVRSMEEYRVGGLKDRFLKSHK